ncbi:MAG TPA: Gfo/Idh/MocA family oxidoreductase [Candidatus Sulfotelmatobacter sp.]|nr:Gfo/Idh/MocA family oxidoreductase [Candidatus Sulfotelmatobacter sp.]
MKVRRGFLTAIVLVSVVTVAVLQVQAQAPQSRRDDMPLDSRQVQTGPLRVVIVGLVHGHAEGFLSGAVKRSDIQIVGVQEPDRALFDQYAKKYGLDAKLYHTDIDEMLRATHPEAVLIYTSTFDHRRVVEICAKDSGAGGARPFTVMMEKPLAVSAEDAHAIAKVAAQSKMTVLVNYFTTWEPSRHAAYEMAKDGSLGNVWKVVAHDGHGGPKEIGVGPEFLGWLTDPKLNGGGALYDFGCYGVDFMTWLMGGAPPLTVTAVTMHIKPDVYPKVDDDATIVLTYPKAVGIVQGSWNWPFGRSDVEIYGKTGELTTVGRDALEVRTAGQKQAEKVPAKGLVPPMDDELNYLRAVARGELKPEGPGSLAVNVVVAEVLDAARESAKTGKTVKLAQK